MTHTCGDARGAGSHLMEGRAALAAAAQRTAELLRSAGGAGTRVRGSEWNVGEVAAHLVVVLRGFTYAARGQLDLVTPHIPSGAANFRERLTAVTSSTLALVPDRRPPALAASMDDAVDDFLATTASRSGDEGIPTPWYGSDASLPVSVATSLLLGEQLVHGYDVAKTIGRPWPIGADEALLLIPVLQTMMPLAVRPEAARRAPTLYEIGIRGGPSFLVNVGHGVVAVDRLDSRRPDCKITADPVAFVLLAYGRVNQWRLAATGKLVGSGRKPWLAARMKNLFFDP